MHSLVVFNTLTLTLLTLTPDPWRVDKPLHITKMHSHDPVNHNFSINMCQFKFMSHHLQCFFIFNYNQAFLDSIFYDAPYVPFHF